MSADRSDPSEALLQVQGLRKYYPAGGRLHHSRLHAVDDVNFRIGRSETLALVGESGSGKSTVARCVMGLEQPDAGQVMLEGRPVRLAGPSERRSLRGKLQMVFQDPLDSLNPRIRVGELMAEPVWLTGMMPRSQAAARVRELVAHVHLEPDVVTRFAHQLSGGQQQRVGIARALATRPAVVVLDEPTSALDVSVQAQIIALLQELQTTDRLAYLLISHDLVLVGILAHRIAVMYMGEIVEMGERDVVLDRPAHPYTRALLASAPGADLPYAQLRGEPASAVDPPRGCRLVGRCPFARNACSTQANPLVETAPGHLVRCSRYVRENVEGVWDAQPIDAAPTPVTGTG